MKDRLPGLPEYITNRQISMQTSASMSEKMSNRIECHNICQIGMPLRTPRIKYVRHYARKECQINCQKKSAYMHQIECDDK